MIFFVAVCFYALNNINKPHRKHKQSVPVAPPPDSSPDPHAFTSHESHFSFQKQQQMDAKSRVVSSQSETLAAKTLSAALNLLRRLKTAGFKKTKRKGFLRLSSSSSFPEEERVEVRQTGKLWAAQWGNFIFFFVF